ncbi:hypothetical protein I3760_11G145100 [Carya illinoinensis]|uniref:Secreted protein n=1 Tax=Carya illinoinensis TaxID=32201 RepID=A0A922DQF3_CARIL|nr:hypothetical protein I3760_11G145100 [Carya illinoinensis]KAG6688891.1 hypothetical protein I3842_11G147800 [Carya illinoinensis]
MISSPPLLIVLQLPMLKVSSLHLLVQHLSCNHRSPVFLSHQTQNIVQVRGILDPNLGREPIWKSRSAPR